MQKNNNNKKNTFKWNTDLFGYQTGDFALDEICQSMAASE